MRKLADWVFESFHDGAHREDGDKLGHKLMRRLDKDHDGTVRERAMSFVLCLCLSLVFYL